MTTFEPTGDKWAVGTSLRVLDKETHKWVHGVIDETGDESFSVKWGDLPEPCEYRKDTHMIEGDILFE